MYKTRAVARWLPGRLEAEAEAEAEVSVAGRRALAGTKPAMIAPPHIVWL